MTDILPPAGWPNVRQLETNEFATGGANGNMNEQAKSLAARSELLKQYAALPYESKTGGYALNERVQLATGDIVRSVIASNVNNPNVDMTGWVKENSTGQIFDASGLSQQQINDGVESISDLLAIANPKNGNTVFVKSSDGGHFTYNEYKKVINDGVIIYNGWARITFEAVYRSEWVGVTGVEGDDCVPKLKKLFEYVAAKGGGTVIIQDGVHSLNTVYVDNADGYTEHYAFGMYNNVTIEGTSRTNTIFKLKDNLTAEAPQRWGLFVDNHRNDIANFTAKNFKVDFNGYNNLCTATLQPVYVVALVWDAYKAKGITFDNIWCDKNSTWNSFFIGARCEDSTIKNCLFTEHSDAIPNNLIKDHSSIYINGKNARVENNVLTMPDDVVSYISTGIECHGENTVCIGNFVNGYGAPFLAASTERHNGDDILFIGNKAYQAQIGFAFNSMNGQLKAQFISNKVTLRKAKASTADNFLRYAHAAIESVGAINSIMDRSAAYSEIYVLNNVFEQEEPTDWIASDNFINICHQVKEAKLFVSKGNTFKNFKGAALGVLNVRNNLNSKIVMDSNTYIDCGEDSTYNAFHAAYMLTDKPFAIEEGYQYNLLDRITISNDKFIDCKFGVLLGKSNDLTAKRIDITGVKYLGSFVPPVLAVKPIDLVSGHLIHLEYETDGFVTSGQSLVDVQGVSGKIKMRRWSSSNVNDYLLKNLEYVKTPYYPWGMRALSNEAPSATGQFGAFPNKNGDRIDLRAPALTGYSSFVRFEGNWYGTGKVDSANIVT